ncbi:retron Eco8 family effector endonuclease [Paenibacillus thiaminolyticus]|uniref:retron Eco8 family effector endonuclease n=1 Tax=Paenibacillus thiaminolyticus TaxID=49283 RepID=UPI00235005BC|nr:retron Eco8 family effector endonuclease [Paenibacillus thiaminolyticus]WCR29480.1 retron Eco8 family effector endonuclease [Paenibacillus thiaminolyticus]
MSIKKITIKNCKSIEFLELNLSKNINCFLGINNVGKSNIMKIIHFFYTNLTREFYDDSMFSKSNPYNDEVEISIEYDFKELVDKVQGSINVSNGFLDDFFSNINFSQFHNGLDPLNDIVEKVKKFVDKYIEKDKCTLTLKYNRKNKSINWNIKDYEFRAFVSVRFPVFFLESRNIDLYNWESIWKLIGEIAPFRKKISITRNIEGIFELDDEGQDNYDTVIQDIISEIEKSNIRIERSNIYEKISQIIQLQLGGKNFEYETHKLKIGSYGMNSYSFMSLYVKLILRLFNNKHLSSPLIMIDEPELHLHLKKIEQFTREIKEYERFSTTKWIFATHSPTFVKNIIVEHVDYEMFHVTNTEFFNNSYVSRINGFKEKKHKLISDNEANLFFSEVCLFVEGDTELEVFRNSNLRVLYPKLNNIDIYAFEGKEDKLKLVNPNDRKTKINYLVMIDMDKILNYSPKKKKYKLSGGTYLNVIKNKNIINREKYHYTKKFNDTYRVRSEITQRLTSNKFEVDSTGLCIEQSDERTELIELIQQYYDQYNFFPLETTIEGALINKRNYHLFYQWIKDYDWNQENFDNLYSILQTEDHKTTFLRLIFFGKTDWFSSEKEGNNQNFVEKLKVIREIRKQLKESTLDFGDKTSGWVTNYLNWFFNRELHIEKSDDIFVNRNLFQMSFPELGKVIEKLEKMV